MNYIRTAIYEIRAMFNRVECWLLEQLLWLSVALLSTGSRYLIACVMAIIAAIVLWLLLFGLPAVLAWTVQAVLSVKF